MTGGDRLGAGARGKFDPARFDVDEINQALGHLNLGNARTEVQARASLEPVQRPR